MDGYISEQEQIERIKSWWNKYGNAVTTGLILLLAVIAGGRWWQQRTDQFQARASEAYMQMLAKVDEKKPAELMAHANNVIELYGKTPYADIAHLFLAQQAIDKNDAASAINHLQIVIDKSHDTALRQIARLRAAQILIQQKHAEQALTLLAVIDNSGFQSLISEARGDAYAALGKRKEAHQHYQIAISDLGPRVSQQPLLPLKAVNTEGA